eukprot:scpid81408/ scgid27297/ 
MYGIDFGERSLTRSNLLQGFDLERTECKRYQASPLGGGTIYARVEVNSSFTRKELSSSHPSVSSRSCLSSIVLRVCSPLQVRGIVDKVTGHVVPSLFSCEQRLRAFLPSSFSCPAFVGCVQPPEKPSLTAVNCSECDNDERSCRNL